MPGEESFNSSDLLGEIEALKQRHKVPLDLALRCEYSTELMELLLRHSEKHGVEISFDSIDEYRNQPPEGLLLISFYAHGERGERFQCLCVGVLERGGYNLEVVDSLLYGKKNIITIGGFFEIQRMVEPCENNAGATYNIDDVTIYVNEGTYLCYIPCTPKEAARIDEQFYGF